MIAANGHKFSALRDHLPYPLPCVIYDPNEVAYYGPALPHLICRLQQHFSLTVGDALVHGGGEEGYLSLFPDKFPTAPSAETLIHFLEKHMTQYSHHVFLFSFKWYPAEAQGPTLNEWVETLKTQPSSLGKWAPHAFETNRAGSYSEFVYFYDFAAEALYEPGENLAAYLKAQEPDREEVPQPTFYHLQHNLEQADKPYYYTFKVKGTKEPYRLRIDSVLLNLYEMGVGVISFHLRNETYPELADILKINQFGRRLYPQRKHPAPARERGPTP